MENASAATTDVEWRRKHASGLVVGVLALATAWFGLPIVARVPLGGLLLNLGLAWGTYAVVEIGIHRRPAPHSQWVPALAPWLAAPMLLRMHLIAMQESLPAWGIMTWTLEAMSVALGVAAALAYCHLLDDLASTRAALACSGGIALALCLVFLLLHVTMPEPVPRGALTVFALGVALVAAAVAAQHIMLRSSSRPAVRVLAGGAALAVMASQLLDGAVTYLAVIDPLGLLDRQMTEQVALSAWLLETTGVGYPIVKWGLALGIAFLLEREWRAVKEPAAKRIGIYLAILFVGLGPALYSTASLLS